MCELIVTLKLRILDTSSPFGCETLVQNSRFFYDHSNLPASKRNPKSSMK